VRILEHCDIHYIRANTREDSLKTKIVTQRRKDPADHAETTLSDNVFQILTAEFGSKDRWQQLDYC